MTEIKLKKVDYKKLEKEFYLPKTTPSIIDIPEMTFIMVDGVGDPNTCAAYKEACGMLYGLSYAIKMSKISGNKLKGYFDYVVPPLEGLWKLPDAAYDNDNFKVLDKSAFHWTSMIRQPEFVDEDIFNWAKDELHKKKPELDLSKARLETYTEGLCVQVMHIGPYDAEPVTIRKMEEYRDQIGYECDITVKRPHHEIYLSDPRRTAKEKLKTVIRHPIRKKETYESSRTMV